MFIINNFLTHQECDFVLSYYGNNSDKIFEFEGTYPIKLDTDILTNIPKFTELLNKIDLEVRKNFTESMTLDNYEIVKWPSMSERDYHYEEPDKCAFFCYLNDDFTGGEIIVSDTVVQPEKGKLLYFDNGQLAHKVNKIITGDRFTLAGWYI